MKHRGYVSMLDRLYKIIDFRLYNLRTIGKGIYQGRQCITHTYRDADCTYVFYFNPDHDEYTAKLKIKYDDGRVETRVGAVKMYNDSLRIRTANDLKIERRIERNAERRKRKDTE